METSVFKDSQRRKQAVSVGRSELTVWMLKWNVDSPIFQFDFKCIKYKKRTNIWIMLALHQENGMRETQERVQEI